MVNSTKPIAALYGGSFDPPHKGHQAIVAQLTALDYIDIVIIVPTFLNPFKRDSLASAEQRLAWCGRVFSDPKVVVDEYEVKQRHSVYTVETLTAMNEHYNVKYLVIGSDNLSTLDQWHDFDTINSMITWLVFTRRGHIADCHKLQNYQVIELNVSVSSTSIRYSRGLEHVDKIIRDEVKIVLKEQNDNPRES